MKNILFFALFLGIACFNNVQAQKKTTIPESVTQIDVNTPTMSLLVTIKDSTGMDITVPILVIDRKGQIDEIAMKRLHQKANGSDVIKPNLKAIQMPEIDGRLFRLTESIEEAMMKVDSIKVIPLRFTDLI
jgi:hypothetical protein